MEIWLVQYLCPYRHAIAAMPYDPVEHTTAEVEGALLAQMHTLGVNAWCGICGSRDLRFDHARTPFTDWTTAKTALAASEQDQIATRAAIERIRRSS